MSEDPITVLERELVAAARRRTEQPHTGRRTRAGRLANILVTAVAVAITAAIGAGGLILLGGHRRSTVTSAVPGRQQLIDIIGALRRPQTKADLNQRILSQQDRPLGLQGKADLPLVRFATTTPWGERLYFVPMKPPTAKQLAGFAHQTNAPARDIARVRARGETLGVFSNGGGGGDASAADIEAGDSLQTEGAGRSFAGGSTKTRLILVVPDGVAKVVFVLPRQSAGVQNGAPTYKHSLNVAVTVQDNVAAVQIPRECCNGRPPMIWYAPDGQVVKRIGNFSSVNRVTASPKPGPETSASRAAERDPSTPNRVWVTPRAGGPHTTFRLHFRVLLSDADYRYTFSGPPCPRFTFPGGTGGGPNDLRGDLWSDPLSAVQGQALCPGTYRVSVTVMDLGRHGNLKQLARPFGTATFKVRR